MPEMIFKLLEPKIIYESYCMTNINMTYMTKMGHAA